MTDSKNKIINNIISLNPTGILQYDGTYKMNGANSIITDTGNNSKSNLEKAEKNEILCHSIEKFENFNTSLKKQNVFFIFILIISFIFIIYFCK